MDTSRPRIASPWLVLLLAAVVVPTFYATYPHGGLRERMTAAAEPSDLSAAYLEAWLRVQPENAELLTTLGAQYAQLGRDDDAERIAQRMDDQHSDELHRAATLLRLTVAEREAFAIPAGDPRRAAALAALRAQLAAVAGLAWDNTELEILAARAAAVGAPELAVQLYARLAAQDPQDRQRWNAEVAKYGLWVGQYRRAAAAWFQQQADAKTRDEQRRCFIAGIRALQSGNLLVEALQAADEHVGTLANDRDTLIVLLNLARAAQRPERVDQYAKALMKYTSAQPHEPRGLQGLRRPFGGFALASLVLRAGRKPGHPPGAYTYMDGPQGGSGMLQPMRERVLRVALSVAANGNPAGSDESGRSGESNESNEPGAAAASASASATAAAPAGVDVASLVYQAFLESSDLDNAQKVAAAQVAKDPHSALWLKRLAQVAEWNRAAPLALQSWLGYAQASNDPLGWSNVLRLAPMLNDDSAYLAALVHASNAAPGDLKLVDSVIATYERLGRPDDGLAFLQAHTRDAGSHAIDERMAILAERAGHDDEALAIWRKLQASEPGNTSYALHAASILYRQGKYADALAVLEQARAGARDDDVLFWRNDAQLARLLQQDKVANDAYKHLLASGEETSEDLSAMTYFYDAYPLDAGRTAQLQYERDNTPRALQSAIYYYTDAQAMDRVAALLDSLTPEQRAAAEQSPDFLGVRAEYYRQTGRPLDALHDLERAVDLPGATPEVRAALIWTLVDYGSDADLRKVLARWRDDAAQNSLLWGPFAAAELRRNRPVAALQYLRLQSALMSRDPLWLLTLADAQEMAGRPELAWSLRRKVWRQIELDEQAVQHGGSGAQAALKRRASQDAEAREQVRGRRVSLAAIFADADVSRGLLDDLLKHDAGRNDNTALRRTLLGDAPGLPPAPPAAAVKALDDGRLKSAVAKDVAVAWALSHEANPLAKRWLAEQYGNRLAQPADSQLAIALAEGDTAAMERLVDKEGARLPLYGRIDATIALDRPGQAEQLAFNGLDGAPEDSELHTRLTETALGWPQSLGTTVENYVEHPLDYVEQTLNGSMKVADRYMIGVIGTQRYQWSVDQTQLVNVPGVDRALDFFVRRQTLDTALQVTGGRREGLDSFYTFNFAGELGRNSNLTLTGSAGRDQSATESQALLIGGMKDNLTGGFNWRMTTRIYASGTLEADRFYSQARDYLGSGVLSSGEIGYKIRTGYPDFTVRLAGARGEYGASGAADALISRLSPLSAGPASAATFMPLTYAQYGLFFGFGNDLLDQYTHRWRPFLDVGIVHNSVQGWGPQVSLGVAGSVFGGDHAALYLEHESVSQVGSAPVTVIGARYSWFY
ncbi:MAG: tetratricopeptide repeat protein [Pseudomonadota bacterium]